MRLIKNTPQKPYKKDNKIGANKFHTNAILPNLLKNSRKLNAPSKKHQKMIRLKRTVEEKEKNPIKEFQSSKNKFKNLYWSTEEIKSEKRPYELNLLIYQSKICSI